MIKYGLLGDLAFFEWLEANGARGAGARARRRWPTPCARSVEMKAEIVAEDEREAGRRALLNLGHTFAHALEAETGFGEALKHGEAVGDRLALAFRFSVRLGLLPGQDAERAGARHRRGRPADAPRRPAPAIRSAPTRLVAPHGARTRRPRAAR